VEIDKMGTASSLKKLDLAKAKKSGTILGDIPIIGGFFKQKEAPATAAVTPTNYVMGNTFTEQIYASPAPASGSVRFTNGAGSFALDTVQEKKLVAAKQAEANAVKHYYSNSTAVTTVPTGAAGRGLPALPASRTGGSNVLPVTVTLNGYGHELRADDAQLLLSNNAAGVTVLDGSLSAPAGRGLPALPSAR